MAKRQIQNIRGTYLQPEVIPQKKNMWCNPTGQAEGEEKNLSSGEGTVLEQETGCDQHFTKPFNTWITKPDSTQFPAGTIVIFMTNQLPISPFLTIFFELLVSN